MGLLIFKTGFYDFADFTINYLSKFACVFIGSPPSPVMRMTTHAVEDLCLMKGGRNLVGMDHRHYTEFSVSLVVLTEFSVSLAETDGKLRQPRVLGRVTQ
jgi:hypothetical protein